MGHLFRALNLIAYLERIGEKYMIVANEDARSIEILRHKSIPFEIADLEDTVSDWESNIVKKHTPSVWINDRLDTNILHSQNIKKNSISLVSFDDTGTGAELADLNFGMMPCNYDRALQGKLVRKGISYFIINPEVEQYRRKRTSLKKIIVTLGGSDTYGVTLKVAERLKQLDFDTTIVTGPSFIHDKELGAISSGHFTVKRSVPSLLKEFYEYDLAITGGGITPFEANASGLPCLIIATEPHETDNALFLERSGSSIYCGFYSDVNFNNLLAGTVDIISMSAKGLNAIDMNGAERVYDEIANLSKL